MESQDAAERLAHAESRVKELEEALEAQAEASKRATTQASATNLLSLELSDYQVSVSRLAHCSLCAILLTSYRVRGYSSWAALIIDPIYFLFNVQRSVEVLKTQVETKDRELQAKV